MPTYQYKCNDCKKKFDIYLTFEEYDQGNVNCPKCHSVSLSRRYDSSPHVAVRGEPTTIGQLADRNAIKNKSKINETEAQNKKSEKPWYQQSTTSRRDINKMTKEQKQRYIMEGK